VDRRADYHFDLPPAQIAQSPAERRDASRLLVVPPGPARDPVDARIVDLPQHIPADAILVVNDTRVIPARIRGQKATGGAVELLFLDPSAHPAPPGHQAWRCLARARRALRAGQVVQTAGGDLRLLDGRADDSTVIVAVPGDAFAFLDAHGEIPLPPYIERAAGDTDRERYQTVFARHPGAVAAPTAGLHFTPALLDALRARGCELHTVTLHVGLGTFSPMRAEALAEHVMHRERYHVPEATAAAIATGRPVVAIGTTVVRTLEAAARGRRDVAAGPGETDLFIHPATGYQFRVVDHLVTNFHLPESTLLMLVCAFAGYQPTLAAYRHAVAAGYRFFSYGDAMLCSRC
jgi:S-adenosylmethionine:tRNA ribosyltransferase-isomerase